VSERFTRTRVPKEDKALHHQVRVLRKEFPAYLCPTDISYSRSSKVAGKSYQTTYVWGISVPKALLQGKVPSKVEKENFLVY
jgi:hypothetical protein